MGGGNRALYEATRHDMAPGGGIFGPMGYIGPEIPTWVTNHLPRTLTSNTDEHLSIFGSWRFVIAFQYAIAFLTIDDVSQAATGRTRITLNKYCDVFVRLAKAFVAMQYNPAA